MSVSESLNEVADRASITEREREQIERANATTATPVAFIHGLWLLPSSWDPWAELFEEAGYVALTPDWPDDPETVEVARAEPEVLAKKTLKQVADHTTQVIAGLDKKPVMIGHSTGGLLAEMLAGQGLAAVTVAIDPGVFRGVLPLPLSVLRSAGPFLVNPRTRGRAITLTFDQFRYSWANALDEDEAMELYDKFHVAASGISLVQMGNANLNPWTEAKVNTKNPDRGPLLIIDGEKDHTVPWAIANAAYKRQKANPGVTEIVKMPDRGHALTIDHGWREVAETALAFVKRFTPSEHRFGAIVNMNAEAPLSFETHVKPLFRERDRQSMEFAFDLWSYDDVSEHADAILARLVAGTMPCDGAWPQAQVDLFRRWTQSGKPG